MSLSFSRLFSLQLVFSQSLICLLKVIIDRFGGLLYIGKAKNLRDRLRGGHKAFLWGWLDRYEPDHVRITFVTINQWQKPGLLYELETLILQASNPPYNVKIPREL